MSFAAFKDMFKPLLAISILLIFPLCPAFAGGLDPTAFSESDVQEYLRKCPHSPPALTVMAQEIRKLLIERRSSMGLIESLTKRWRYPLNWQFRVPKVTVDQFELKNIHAVDLDIFLKFTFPNSYHTRTHYRKNDLNTFVIARTCPGDHCRGFDDINLKSIARDPNDNCTDVLCAFKSVFGEERGIKYLWDYLINDSNLSPLISTRLDLEGFTDSTLLAILTAYNLIPPHLKKSAVPRGFKMVRGINFLGQYANALGMVFDSMEELTFAEKVYAFYHELGHRVRDKDRDDFQLSPSWLNLTGWAKTGPGISDWSNSSTGPFPSKYAAKNPQEDFAESFTLYRFNSKKLGIKSPVRHGFMRNNVYGGIEYAPDNCQPQRSR